MLIRLRLSDNDDDDDGDDGDDEDNRADARRRCLLEMCT